MMVPYKDQLKDPRWQKKRLLSLERSGWGCELCGDKTTTLHVHHKRYIKGRMAWEYELTDLAVLCDPCHMDEHAEQDLLKVLLSESGPGRISEIVGLVGGWLAAELSLDPATAFQARETREPYYELGALASAVSILGLEGWRAILRKIAAENSVTPHVRHMIEAWDDKAT